MGRALLWPLVTRKSPEQASPLTEHAFWRGRLCVRRTSVSPRRLPKRTLLGKQRLAGLPFTRTQREGSDLAAGGGRGSQAYRSSVGIREKGGLFISVLYKSMCPVWVVVEWNDQPTCHENKWFFSEVRLLSFRKVKKESKVRSGHQLIKPRLCPEKNLLWHLKTLDCLLL